MARRRTLGTGQAPTPSIIDLKVLVVAAVVASPAAWRASQGLLTVDEAITRILLVTVACLATAVVVRAVWPILAGPVASADTDPLEMADLSTEVSPPLE